MANTTVLLREDIEHLGGRGEIVKVRAGYARNFLLPQGVATLATKGNIKQIEQEREALLKRAAVERTTAEAQRDQMAAIELTFARKAGEHGQLFGSVTSMDIAQALNEKGYEIDRRRINLREAIKDTGVYTVNVKLHRDVILAVPVTVTTEDGQIIEKPVEAKPEPIKVEAPVQEEAAPVSEENEEAAEADADAGETTEVEEA